MEETPNGVSSKKRDSENLDKERACIFCKIVNGEIPSDILYEDEKVILILDINPYVRGHCLVIPKEHSRWLWDMKKQDYDYLRSKVLEFAKVLRVAFDVEWVEEVVAGKGVEHTHIHLMPRTNEDGLGEIPIKSLNPKPSEKETKEISEKIKMALRRVS